MLPTGEIVAHPWRGTRLGNRGILHRADGRLGVSRWKHKAWVLCVLEFKGRQRQVMSPGTYTELFFADDAAGLAAGHRPCGECRRATYEAFRDAFAAANGVAPRAPGIDARLHADRLAPRTRAQKRFGAPAESLPDGAFVLWHGQPHLLVGDRALPFAAPGYAAPVKRPAGTVAVLTPRATVAALAEGFRPEGLDAL